MWRNTRCGGAGGRDVCNGSNLQRWFPAAFHIWFGVWMKFWQNFSMNYARGCWNAASTQRHKETCSGSPQTTHCHLTHEPNQSPLQKADSLTLGRESQQWTPSAVGCRGGEMRAACREVLQCSTRWCCILEITLPCGSLNIDVGSKMWQTHRYSF